MQHVREQAKDGPMELYMFIPPACLLVYLVFWADHLQKRVQHLEEHLEELRQMVAEGE